MNKAEGILNDMQGRCRTMGVELVKVAEIEIETAPIVYYNDVNQFMDRLSKKAKEVFYRRSPPEYPDDDDQEEIQEIKFFFVHNGVCNVLDVDEEGVMEY